MPELSYAERCDWLQLIRTPSIGPVTFHKLMAKFGDAENAVKELPGLSRSAGRKAPVKIPDRRKIEDELAEADRQGARAIAACEEDYPAALRAIADFPPLIYVRGHTTLFDKPAVAIIGARNASGVGRKMSRTLAAELGAAGTVVVSGLARGIDGAAHAAALESGTIAVVAGGVDVIYPPEHAELTQEIARQGAVISECPIGAQPTARDFPKRNRLISGLSRGVIVVEAAIKSGTLITARYALEQGREVFAVPGSPMDPRCQGANRLIRDGATLIQSAEDVIEMLADQNRGVSENRRDLFDWVESDESGEPDPALVVTVRKQIMELLNYTPIHRDEILSEIDAARGIMADALLELVLAGEVHEHTGGRFSLSVDD